jgi:Sec7-like guanine-nucleotide exchange factor
MAMRFLLLHLPLPKEQGSIYRLLELFSQKYHLANPGLWDSHDQILVVCYSILMLNTDTWNTNNKVKMTREQYIKNTSGQGVSEDILSVPSPNYPHIIPISPVIALAGSQSED